MIDALTVLPALAIVVFVPIQAAKGAAYRGAYGAAAVGGLVLALVALSFSGPVDPHWPTNQQVGQAAINTVAPIVISWGLALACGSVLGVLLYRPRKSA